MKKTFAHTTSPLVGFVSLAHMRVLRNYMPVMFC